MRTILQYQLVVHAATALAYVALFVGCAGRTSGYAPTTDAERRPVEAELLNREAAEYLTSDPARAEDLLRRSLTLDLYCGPAHNNLGVLHLSRGELYEAAHEFEWARKLLPGHPDPRLNLALTLRKAGKHDDALAAARAALETRVDYVPAKQAVALLLARRGERHEESRSLLRDLTLEGATPEWRAWAREELIRGGAEEP